MRIGLRGGHNPYCKGARGKLDEQTLVWEVAKRVTPVLEKYGHTVINCNGSASNSRDELIQGTNKANSNNCDIYIPIHANIFNGQAFGTEALIYSLSSSKARGIGERFCNNMAQLGFRNRGIKIRPELHDLRATRMEAVIFELFFIDNNEDVARWNSLSWDTIIYNICNAIDPAIPRIPPENKPPENTYFRVICGSFKDRANAEKRKSELEAKGFTGTFLEAFRK